MVFKSFKVCTRKCTEEKRQGVGKDPPRMTSVSNALSGEKRCPYRKMV